MEREQPNPNRNESLPADLLQPVSELSRRVDSELDADRAFFRGRPDRQHYVRRVFPNERLQTEFLGGRNLSFDPLTHAAFVAVKKVHRTARVRVTFIARRDTNTDMSEREAKKMFNRLSTTKVQEIVSMLKATAA
jgi:hypothetical protein